MDQEKIGKFIAALRKDKNMTQEELAEKLGINSKSISRWENGKCMPDLSLLVPLSKELNMSVNDILSGKKNDEKDYKEVFEENITNIVSKVDKDKKRFRLKVICIVLFLIILVIPLMVLCSGQFLKAPWISFSSFKVMNKANQFYTALQKNDIDAMDKLVTDNVEDMCWRSFGDISSTKNNFLDSLTILKDKRVEYTSLKLKGFRYNNYTGGMSKSLNETVSLDEEGVSVCTWPSKIGFIVEYEMCFEDHIEKACINIVFQLDDNDKIIFNSFASDSNLLNKIHDKYNPVDTGNVYYNRLHLSVDSVFNGFLLD